MSEIELPEPAGHVIDMMGEDGWAVSDYSGALSDGCDVYTDEQVRQAVLAERERCARVCEELRDKALSAQHGRSDDLQNVMLRQVAHTGAGECAAAIRRGSV